MQYKLINGVARMRKSANQGIAWFIADSVIEILLRFAVSLMLLSAADTEKCGGLLQDAHRGGKGS